MHSTELRRKLKGFGISDEALSLAWPAWWSDEAESSDSARAELRFVLSRRLGLDARALLGSDEPVFTWTTATFKDLTATSATEKAAIVSYGISLARVLVSATPSPAPPGTLAALALREQLLRTAPHVGLTEVLTLCWSIGVPVLQLRVFPLPAKRMCAMAVRVGARHAILLAKESTFPAQIAYYVAHELGHIALGHLLSQPALVDVADPLGPDRGSDLEERDADQFALEVLTGDKAPDVRTTAQRFSATSLAKAVLSTGPQLRIDPGSLALCFGHNTGHWVKVFGALKILNPKREDVGIFVNRVAFSQLEMRALSDESEEFIRGAAGEA